MFRSLFFFLSGVFVLVPNAGARVDDAKVKKWGERKNFVARESTEAEVVFEHFVELVGDKPTKEEALDQIDEQLWHLFGPLSVAQMYAAPKANHRVTDVKITKKETGEEDAQLWNISYTYKGTMQVKNGAASKFVITLPTNPDTIYQTATTGPRGGFVKNCTDPHYTDVGDFWYFWNPDNAGCKKQIKKGRDYEEVTVSKLNRIPNTKISYPDYPRLASKDGVVRIDVLMGLDEPKEAAKSRDPFTSSDINATTYTELRERLVELGFGPEDRKESQWSLKQIEEVAPLKNTEFAPYVETLTKQGTRVLEIGGKQVPVTLEVRLFFGPSGIQEGDNQPFHYFLKDALENASIFVYDGHSGLGGHLNIADIEEANDFDIKLPKNKYQMYFFNSCTSYTYYNLAYFEEKQTASDKEGTKNLDILVNGLATSFYVLNKTNLALIEGVDLWANKRRARSFQDLAKAIDSSNLFSVNGDEDNPTRADQLN